MGKAFTLMYDAGMHSDRLGGLELEPIPFLDEWIPADANDHVREVMLERKRNIQVFRFFYQSGANRVEGFLVEPKEGGSLPCIIYNRGGTGDFGSMSDEFLWTSNIARFANDGYCVITTQYSGAGRSEGEDDHGGPQTFNDVICLYDLLRLDPRVGVNRIGAYGGSRGAVPVFQLMRSVPWLKAAIALSPSCSYARTGFRPSMERHYDEWFKGEPDAQRFRSVLEFTDELSKSVPLLLMHGTADWRTNPMETLELAKRCYEEKVPCRLMMFEGGEHNLGSFFPEPYRQALRWFHRFVRDLEPLPNLEPHGD